MTKEQKLDHPSKNELGNGIFQSKEVYRMAKNLSQGKGKVILSCHLEGLCNGDRSMHYMLFNLFVGPKLQIIE